MRTETKALKMRSAKRESDVAGMSPLLEGLRASPDVLRKKQCLSSQCQRWVESAEARTQRRVSSHREIPSALSGDLPQGSLFWVNILSSRFYFWFGVLFFVFFFKANWIEKNWNSRYVYYDGKNQR